MESRGLINNKKRKVKKHNKHRRHAQAEKQEYGTAAQAGRKQASLQECGIVYRSLGMPGRAHCTHQRFPYCPSQKS